MTRPSTLRGAPGLFRAALLVLLVAPGLLACGPSTHDSVRSCTTPADCGLGATCVQGACQLSARPTATFEPPASISTHRAVTVTATASDPDAGAAVASWAWSITRLTAACDADADATDGPALQAVFWCAGSYELSLVVTGATGAESEPVRRTVTVTALENPPQVTAGPAVNVDHRCSGSPLRCELAAPVALSASGTSPAGGALGYQWSALPPDPSRAAATVLLSPSTVAPSPTLAIETGGGAISGTWRLRVRVTDGAGHLAQAYQPVVVGNRDPMLDGTAVSLDHVFSGSRYRANGPLSVAASDPDGDPVEVELELLEPAASGCDAAFSPSGGGAGQLALSCPGPGGLASSGRALRATALDPNGGSGSALVPLQIRNRLPVVRPRGGAVSELPLDHTVGACPGGPGRCFLAAGAQATADGDLFVVEDPDGDPVSGVTILAGVDPSCASSVVEVGVDGSFRFSTPVERPAEFRTRDGASRFWVSATAADPFGASAPAEPVAILINNRPPVVKTPADLVSVVHRYDAATGSYLAPASLAVFEDPDGDPLSSGGGTVDSSCHPIVVDAGGAASVSCHRAFSVATGGYPPLAGFPGVHLLQAVVTDGWESASASTALTIENRKPVVADYDGAVDACACECAMWEPEAPSLCTQSPLWVPDTLSITFAQRPVDEDGDPLAVTFTSGGSVTPPSVTALPSDGAATITNPVFPVSVQVTVNDGVSQATATWTARAVTCFKSGTICPIALARLRAGR